MARRACKGRAVREPGPAPAFEIYLNNPDGTEPEELITDIHVPLA